MLKRDPKKTFNLLFLICLGMLIAAVPVRAQFGREISLSAPEVENYPEITLYFEAIGRDGKINTNLQEDQITLTENGVDQELLDFQIQTPGIQLVTAFNISNPFAIQDINGNSRFDFIKDSLLNWANQPLTTSPDNISMISNDGLEHTHLEENADFIKLLENYNPAIRELESNFNVLSKAIDFASDPVDQRGMKRVVLLFTSQPITDEYAAIDNLLSQAQDNQVMVYTILISSPAFFNTAGATKLQTLSAETGGLFLPFSGEEPLPDLGQLLLPLRSTYQINYQSQIVTSGMHTLEVSISSSIGESVGEREFFLDVQPPNPIFISPPRSITRTMPENISKDTVNGSYQPESYPLNFLIEFPDNHPRELEEVIIRIDGEIVESKNSPPYDQFIWDLRSYETSATHYLTIEVIDRVGLSRISIETPIEVIVKVPLPSINTLIGKNAAALAGLALILVLGMSLFVLISRGRIQPGKKNDLPLITFLKSLLRKVKILIKKLKSSKNTSTDRIPELEKHPYRLVPINDISQQLFPEPIRIDKHEIILGNNPQGKNIQIKHPSVINNHAKINSQTDGKFQITDYGSTAGTWINYQQILSTKPQFIKDGDIINIGEAGFRFQVMEKTEPHLSPRSKQIDS